MTELLDGSDFGVRSVVQQLCIIIIFTLIIDLIFYYSENMSNPWKPNKPSQPPSTQPPANTSKPMPPWMKNKS